MPVIPSLYVFVCFCFPLLSCVTRHIKQSFSVTNRWNILFTNHLHYLRFLSLSYSVYTPAKDISTRCFFNCLQLHLTKCELHWLMSMDSNFCTVHRALPCRLDMFAYQYCQTRAAAFDLDIHVIHAVHQLQHRLWFAISIAYQSESSATFAHQAHQIQSVQYTQGCSNGNVVSTMFFHQEVCHQWFWKHARTWVRFWKRRSLGGESSQLLVIAYKYIFDAVAEYLHPYLQRLEDCCSAA